MMLCLIQSSVQCHVRSFSCSHPACPVSQIRNEIKSGFVSHVSSRLLEIYFPFAMILFVSCDRCIYMKGSMYCVLASREKQSFILLFQSRMEGMVFLARGAGVCGERIFRSRQIGVPTETITSPKPYKRALSLNASLESGDLRKVSGCGIWYLRHRSLTW